MSGACDNFILEDQSCEWFELVQYVESFDMGINFLEGKPGPPGPAGEAIFIPSVSKDGVLSWTNTAGLPNPDPIDLSGPAGTTDYHDLTNKPSINGVELDGNKTTADLQIVLTAADVGLGNVANERQYSAQNPPPYPDLTNKPSINSVTLVGNKTAEDLRLVEVIGVAAAFAIPAEGSSVSYNLAGLTADHELSRWNFSTSAENDAPAKLAWATYAGYFTITNNGGTTSESMRPVFELPTKKAATTR